MFKGILIFTWSGFKDIITWFLNYVVAYFPMWIVRSAFYRLYGVKMGKGCHICIGAFIRDPWRLKLGNGVVINEKCVIDAGGGVIIEDDSSISRGTFIYSITHNHSSSKFEIITDVVHIGENVWTGVNSVILPGSRLEDGVILGAGSVATKGCVFEKDGIYAGQPAQFIKKRNREQRYTQRWYPLFR